MDSIPILQKTESGYEPSRKKPGVGATIENLALTVSGGPGLLDPVSEMAHEVEEEVSLGHTDHLVRNLDEEAEAL